MVDDVDQEPIADAPDEADASEADVEVLDEPEPTKAELRAREKAHKRMVKAEKKRHKAAERARASTEGGVVHSVQLDDRLRRGDAEATPLDFRLKLLLDVAVGLTVALLLLVLIGRIGPSLGIGFALSIAQQTMVLTLVAVILGGAGFAFNAINWRALRGSSGVKILEKWKADLQLTVVSILALFTVGFILVVEILALLTFIGAFDAGQAGAAFASQFVLFTVIILLVQVMAFVVRIYNISSYKPSNKAVLMANILTPMAGLFMLLGVLLATGLPQSAGFMADIAIRQAIYVVTVGVGLEFLAMRVRLRLPSVYSLFMAAVETSRRANEEMKVELQRRALRTYLAAAGFVAASMAFAAASLTGNLAINNTRIGVAALIFYAGIAVIILGLVLLRFFQGRNIAPRDYGEDDLSRLVGQKRRSAQEIARMGIYAVTGLVSAVFIIAAVALFVTSEEVSETVERERKGELIEVVEKSRVSMLGIPTTYAMDILLAGVVFGAGPFGYFYNQELKRIEAIDEKFPDFLRDIAESARAGMTLPRALVTASRGTYGALTPEIQKMAAQVEWGVEFGVSLERFAERARTPLIDRTVALVVEAQRAGGNVVDILTAASDDAREIKQIVSERNEQMKMYSVVVFIAFFVFIAVVLILSAQFLPAFKEAVDAATGDSGGAPQSVGGITLAPFDVQLFNDLFYHAAVIQAVGGSLVGGVMTKGNPVGGFNNMFVMMLAAWISFRVILPAMVA